MKKIILTSLLIGLMCNNADAAKSCQISNTPMDDGSVTYTYDASCSPGTGGIKTACDLCSGSSTTNSYGIVVSQSAGSLIGDFPSWGGLVTCTCQAGRTTYRCASGYYGTATSVMAGCTACPANATCAGGNGSTFSCNAGYYKNGTACTKCSTATGHGSATSAAGSTAITDCYLPSGTAFSDSTGSGKISGGNCFWKN